MSAAGVNIAINKIAGDLLALAASVLEDEKVSTNPKVGRNTLRDSALRGDLAGAIYERGNDVVISALFNNYVVYIERDRPPKYGKWPPISALRDWAAKNGIPTDAGTLYAISYAIWRDGHVGRPIFATMDAEIDRLFDKDWGPMLFDAIVDQLDAFFIN